MEENIQSLDFSSLLTYHPQPPSLQLESWATIRDKTTQTDEEYITDLKAVEYDLGELIGDTRELEKDLKLMKHMLVAKFDSKLRERSLELSRSCSQRLIDLEAKHGDELDTLRDSFKTQLRDGLQLIAGEYKRYYEELTAGDGSGLESKLANLKIDNTTLSEKILELESQLTLEKKETAQLKRDLTDASAKEEFQPWEVPDHKPSQENTGLTEEEGTRLKSEILRLDDKVEILQEQVRNKELVCRKLEGKIESVQADVKREKKEKEKIQNEFQTYKRKADEGKAKSSADAAKELALIQHKANEEMENAKNSSSKESHAMMEEVRMKERAKMQVEVKKVQEELEKIRKERDDLLKQDLNTALTEAQERENDYKKSIDTLNKELARSNRTWAKKIQILEAHLHAVKDESYIRHSLEKKASSLHQATLAYASEADTHSQAAYPALPCTFGTLSKQRY
ncbi:hypothetical protein LOD99_13143 [Oopsacas minuta]|uniref:DUF4709 domain-containing protein n=1 Tax=Oopsacas minuta TaxID=111878 RepID=A0AAV7JAY5_9METZ|nr:hypothetical protein LOD99_13143 [Oopsacas minuta]